MLLGKLRQIAGVAAAFAVFALLNGRHACAQDSGTVINASVTLVESGQESGPVQRATKDLQDDFGKVFGQVPKIVSDVKDAGPTAILIAQRENVPAGVDCVTTANTEAFAFSITGEGVGPTHRRVICLTGADMRGTIYSIYEFSQTVLGVDPLYLWTDKQPAKRVSITLPKDFAKTYPSPVFKYRGFFPNDEDLLTGWVVPPKGEQDGIALSVWDQIFETILRLKGNMVVPGTWTFPDDAPVHAATERGLIVNQHHA
ncbi:MAG TPA: glycosyl hydrolase 115 family protein, partial [Terracidiphilus sp.]|nr:glycosyl hydrolase 115 family protein [Terracidiphilus sp.]